MPAVVVRPRAPRDGRDAFIAVVTLLVIAAAGVLAAYVPLRLALNPFDALAGALVLAGLLLLGIALCGVSALELDDTGIRFRRFTGRPRFLPWERITGIRPAARDEVVLRGWLVPPIPPRAAALSLTSLGQYRFDWPGGSCYFPPADEHALLEVLQRNWGGVVGVRATGSAD